MAILGVGLAVAQQPPATRAGGRARRARRSPDPAEGRGTGADPRQERADRGVRQGTAGQARRCRSVGRCRGVRQGGPDAAGVSRALRDAERHRPLAGGAGPGHRAGQTVERRRVAVELREEADSRLLFGDRRVGAALRRHAAGRVRPGKTGAALRLDARAAEQHYGIGVHFQPADLPAGECAGGRPGADPARSVRADQRRGLALGGRGRRLRGHRGGQEALQDRRPARDAARLLDGRRRARGTSRCTIRIASRRPKSAPGRGRAAGRCRGLRRISTPR